MNYFYNEHVKHQSFWESLREYRLPSITNSLLPLNMFELDALHNNQWMLPTLDLLLVLSILYGISRLCVFVLDLLASLVSFVPSICTHNVGTVVFSMFLGYAAYVFSLGVVEAENNLAFLFEWLQAPYNRFLIQFVNYCFGFDLATQSETEITVWGTLLFMLVSCVVFYYLSFIYQSHRMFAIFLVFASIFIYTQTFTVTPKNINFYATSKSFVLDKDNSVAYIAPSTIPKIILILVVFFQLFLTLLRILRYMLHISVRIIFLLLLVPMVLHTILSLSARHQLDESSDFFVEMNSTNHVIR